MPITQTHGAMRRSAGVARHARRALLVAGTAMLGACSLFETDINNPNAVVEGSLTDPAAAATLVNGLGASITRAHNQLVGTVGAVSDELTWSGSREFWNLLDQGDISDPVNEYTDGLYPYLSEARWMADYLIPKLEGWDKEGKLRSRVDLARGYTYAGLTYLLIGENYEDFITASDRQANEAPLGDAAFLTVFDSAVKYLDKAVTTATAASSADWQRNALGLRARAKWSKAAMAMFRPARGRPASPYINDAGANADALAALNVMTSGYRFRTTSTAQNAGGYFNTGFEIVQRLELRAGDEYINPNAARTRPLDGLAGIKLNDPISGQPDPVLNAAINECCRQTSSQFQAVTAASQVEMLLILAEAALATGNTAEFTNRINAVRSLNGVPAWAGTPSAQAVLIHARRVNLYMQGRRLTDHYRFNQNADRWLPARVAARKSCFFPISYNERLQNPKAPQPAVDRAANCT